MPNPSLERTSRAAQLNHQEQKLTVSDATKSVPGLDKLCKQCGHLINPHRLLGYGNPPTQGWTECPVEGCGCKMTWSADPEAAEHIKNIFFEMRSEEGDTPWPPSQKRSTDQA
jgi:hypothetical protein